jgi:peptide/nickel transport system substrate-binding protein
MRKRPEARPRLRAAIVLLAAMAACSTPIENRVRVGVDVDAGSLDPRMMRDTTSYRVVDLLYDGLVRLDRDLKPTPGLAESWDQRDETHWVFHLRPDARFHDGRAVSSEDVRYTLETMLDPAFGAPLRSLYQPIEKVEAPDPLTVSITLRAPYAPLLSYLDLGIVPRGSRSSDLESSPVGTGPYRMKEWARGSTILLEANPDFWGGAPAIHQIELVLVPDNTARAQAFEAGDLDLIQSPLSPPDIRRLATDERFVKDAESGPAITYLNFNCARPPLDEPGVRRALSMLVDQDTILTRIYENTDEKARSILLPSSWSFTIRVQQPSYDPEGAVALLDELGWKDRDGDGVLDKNGKRLAIELSTHGEDVNRVQTLEYFQNVLRGRGIEAEVKVTDWPSFSVRRDAGDYDVILLGWTQLVDPDKETFDQFHSRGGLNWGSYRNSEVDALLERGRSTTALEERAEIYRRVAAIVASEVPYYVLSYQGYHSFHSSRIEGYVADPRGMLRGLATSRLRTPEER